MDPFSAEIIASCRRQDFQRAAELSRSIKAAREQPDEPAETTAEDANPRIPALTARHRRRTKRRPRRPEPLAGRRE